MSAEHAALTALLLQLADDELILGHRNSEWTGLGPILEEDIAFSSMAQDEIGHAQVYYRLLENSGEPPPDALVFLRTADQFRNAQLVELPRTDYAFSLVRHVLYDLAEQVRLEALVHSSYQPLAVVAGKLRHEERYHALHGRTWLKQLALANDDSHDRVQQALDRLFPYALSLFEPGPREDWLLAHQIQPAEMELQQAWFDLLQPLLHEVNLHVPLEAAGHGWRVTAGIDPHYGGRYGHHTPHLAALLADMQLVYRADPGAAW